MRNSAKGTADHTPFTCQNSGSTKRKTVIKPNVRKKDITADIFPLDSAVNKAEEIGRASCRERV